MKHGLNVVLGCLVSIALLYCVIQKVNIEQTLDVLTHIDVMFLGKALICLLGFVWLSAVRWNIILKEANHHISVGQLLGIISMGYMGNMLLPARAGEVLRVFALKQFEGVKKTTATSTIVVEKMNDGLVHVSILIAAIAAFLPDPASVLDLTISLRNLHLTVLGAGLFYGIAILLLMILRHRIRFWAAWFGRWTKSAVAHSFNFVRGLTALSRLSKFFFVLLLSYLMWLCCAGIVHYCLLAVHVTLPFTAALFAMTMIAVGCALPSSPGFVGALQFFAVAALAFYGVDHSVALGFSVIYHIVEFLPLTVMGIMVAIRKGLSFKEMRKLR